MSLPICWYGLKCTLTVHIHMYCHFSCILFFCSWFDCGGGFCPLLHRCFIMSHLFSSQIKSDVIKRYITSLCINIICYVNDTTLYTCLIELIFQPFIYIKVWILKGTCWCLHKAKSLVLAKRNVNKDVYGSKQSLEQHYLLSRTFGSCNMFGPLCLGCRGSVNDLPQGFSGALEFRLSYIQIIPHLQADQASIYRDHIRP